MSSMQYTIRSIPAKTDQALRARAKKSGQSLNDVVLEALAVATGTGNSDALFTDLDWFIGQKTLCDDFDEAMQWHDAMPTDIG